MPPLDAVDVRTWSAVHRMVPLLHESYGRMGQPARQLLNGLAILASSSGAIRKAQFVESGGSSLPRQLPHRCGICRAQCAHERQRPHPWTTCAYHQCRCGERFVKRVLGCFVRVCRLWFNASCCFTFRFVGLSVTAPCACFLCSVTFPVVSHTAFEICRRSRYCFGPCMHAHAALQVWGLPVRGFRTVGCAAWGAWEWLGVVPRVLLAR